MPDLGTSIATLYSAASQNVFLNIKAQKLFPWDSAYYNRLFEQVDDVLRAQYCCMWFFSLGCVF